MPPLQPDNRRSFGERVRVARTFAKLSQEELSEAISERFPDYASSTATIKRLESGDLSVKGAIQDWAQRVSAVTLVPQWFLLSGWAGAESLIEEMRLPQRNALKQTEEAGKEVAAELEMARVSEQDARARVADAERHLEELKARQRRLESEVAQAQEFAFRALQTPPSLTEVEAAITEIRNGLVVYPPTGAKGSFDLLILAIWSHHPDGRRVKLPETPKAFIEVGEALVRAMRNDDREGWIAFARCLTAVTPGDVIAATATPPAAGGFPAPPGELGRRASGSQPTTPEEEPAQRRRAQDDPASSAG